MLPFLPTEGPPAREGGEMTNDNPAGGSPNAESPNLGERPWLVLGGGGMKGLAHVGAWQALRETNFHPAGIVGTSIGAMVGACLAAGMEWSDLVPIAFAIERGDVARINRRAALLNGVRQEALLLGEPLRDTLRAVLGPLDWSDLSVPLLVNAVDLGTGETVWFGDGADTSIPLLDALYASAALPVFYPPIVAGGRTLVDGGVEFTLALHRAAESGATGIVAVDVGSRGPANPDEVREQGMIAIHQRVFSIMAERARSTLVRDWTDPPMLYVRPRLDGVGTFDFDRTDYLLSEGYRAARAALAREHPK